MRYPSQAAPMPPAQAEALYDLELEAERAGESESNSIHADNESPSQSIISDLMRGPSCPVPRMGQDVSGLCSAQELPNSSNSSL